MNIIIIRITTKEINMANEYKRKEQEIKNLFSDPKYVRQAWKAVGNAMLQNPAAVPVPMYDKEGNQTLASQLEAYSYNQLAKDIEEVGKEKRKPTEIEVILHCQMLKARFDTAAATFVRDTLGAKPVDESKVDAQVSNPYESLSDEELELLAKYREEQLKAVNNEPVRED